ncbi:MAG: hypothetical protein NC548_47415 [Lachnospiraceae bacterium]|nr:hypothetical protein [Lachnospiraceae bacterium]
MKRFIVRASTQCAIRGSSGPNYPTRSRVQSDLAEIIHIYSRGYQDILVAENVEMQPINPECPDECWFSCSIRRTDNNQSVDIEIDYVTQDDEGAVWFCLPLSYDRTDDWDYEVLEPLDLL